MCAQFSEISLSWKFALPAWLGSRVVATKLALPPRNFVSIHLVTRDVRFCTASKSVLGPTLPPLQWVKETVSAGLRWPGLEAEHWPRDSNEFNDVWLFTSIATYVLMLWFWIKCGNLWVEFLKALPQMLRSRFSPYNFPFLRNHTIKAVELQGLKFQHEHISISV